VHQVCYLPELYDIVKFTSTARFAMSNCAYALKILTEVKKKNQCREKLMVACLAGSVLWVGIGEVPGRKPGPHTAHND